MPTAGRAVQVQGPVRDLAGGSTGPGGGLLSWPIEDPMTDARGQGKNNNFAKVSPISAYSPSLSYLKHLVLSLVHCCTRFAVQLVCLE